jgi:hypothetical protein
MTAPKRQGPARRLQREAGPSPGLKGRRLSFSPKRQTGAEGQTLSRAERSATCPTSGHKSGPGSKEAGDH